MGGLLLLGLTTEAIGKFTPLPRVTLLVLFGVLIGPAGFDLLPVSIERWYSLFADIALLMVGFLLGGKLSSQTLRETGRPVVWISIFQVVGVAAAIFIGLTVLGFDPIISLLLAGIAPASAPAAVTNVVSELDIKGRFTDILLGIVALDDAWGLIAFSLLLAVAQSLGEGSGAMDALRYGAWELGGALLVGVGLGLPAAFLTGRVKPGEPTQAEALGLVFLCGGIALWLEVSFLLAAMIVGAVVVNFAKHHNRPFREIENIEWPFMIFFFVLAGASLHVDRLLEIGFIGVAYILLRVVGKIAAGWLGGWAGKVDPLHRRWIGVALTPQAGVALGMALVAGSRFPELQDHILAIVIGTTVVFELTGPVATRLALLRAKRGDRQD